MCGHTRKDKIQNDCILGDIGAAPIEKKKSLLRWLCSNKAAEARCGE